MTESGTDHSFRVIEGQIGIFPDRCAPPVIDMDGEEKIVLVSIGAGETHVTVLTDEATMESQWTAVFGWSSLCKILEPYASGVHIKGPEQISRALKGTLRFFGRSVDTSGAMARAEQHFTGAIGYILDETIGQGEGFDRIMIAAPYWCHDALRGCLDLRPHIVQEIEDL